MSGAPMIDVLIQKVQNEFTKDTPSYISRSLMADDVDVLIKECNQESEFDAAGLRNKMFKKMEEGRAIIRTIVSKYGTIIGIFNDHEQIDELPWALWLRILRLFSGNTQRNFKIFLLANEDKRQFPKIGQPITPININGGYTYPCNTQSIIIYRAEDATRVLIHELMHASCLDDFRNSVDIIESETEAWAELIYVAIISQGKKFIFNDLLQRQSEFMRKQNALIRKYYMRDPTSTEFPWRYTIGKEDVWKRWGILNMRDYIPKIGRINTLRLTYPPNNMLKDRFKVLKSSTML